MQVYQAAIGSAMVCRSAGGAHARMLCQNAMASSSVIPYDIANGNQVSSKHEYGVGYTLPTKQRTKLETAADSRNQL